jgi:hypothetical protein
MGIIIRKNRNIQENVKVRQDVKNIDLIHGTVPEQEGADVGVEEFSGYHRNTVQSYMNGVSGSPYSRQMDAKTGALKACGINFYDRLVQRHEMLIQSTGEPVHLLRRKWTGELCPCFDKQRLRANARCSNCFGVGYVGGYVGFINPKEPDGRIWLRVYPNMEDMPSHEQGISQDNQITAWALPTPILRDRDVIIRYDPNTGEESWRYVVLNIQRNMGLFNTHTAQVVTISRVDKTHPMNHVRVVDLLNNQVGDLVGKGDELQDLIESESGDGYNDGGFSLGYFSGYDAGYHDAFYQKPFRSIPDDNQDGWIDHPFDNNRRPGDTTEFWLAGYRCGYGDGFDDGDKQRMTTNPPQRLEDFERRRVDIASNTLGHPDPRVSPPPQVGPGDHSNGTSGVNPLAVPGNPYPEPGTQMPPPGTCP